MVTAVDGLLLATAGVPVFVTLLTAFNSLVWPRGKDDATVGLDDVSVLIPARNEETTIRATVVSALAQTDVAEVCVYDDGSTDSTPAILAELAATDERLKLVEAQPLPAGWVGKPHACTRLGEAASGDLLLFLDADVELTDGAVRRVRSLFRDYDADAVTAMPRQSVETWFESWILPLLHTTYLSWLPLPLIWRTKDPRFLAANGQVLAVSRDAYEAIGGFASVSDAVVDDMAFCGRLKSSGRRVVFADGDHIARCRMYEDASGVWAGFSKNIREGVGSTLGVFGVIGLYLFTFVWPWLAWIPGVAGTDARWLWAAAIGVTANVIQRLIIAIRHHYSLTSIWTIAPGAMGLCCIALNSVLWQHRDSIVWAGRTYARRENRHG